MSYNHFISPAKVPVLLHLCLIIHLCSTRQWSHYKLGSDCQQDTQQCILMFLMALWDGCYIHGGTRSPYEEYCPLYSVWGEDTESQTLLVAEWAADCSGFFFSFFFHQGVFVVTKRWNTLKSHLALLRKINFSSPILYWEVNQLFICFFTTQVWYLLLPLLCFDFLLDFDYLF